MKTKPSILQAGRQLSFACAFSFFSLLLLAHFSNSMVLNAVGAGSLSSTFFLTFAQPSSQNAQWANISGGYACGILVGIIFHYINLVWDVYQPILDKMLIISICTCGAVVASYVLMIIFHVPHPPASGIALGLVIEHWNSITLFCLMAVIFILCYFLHRNGNRLHDLITKGDTP